MSYEVGREFYEQFSNTCHERSERLRAAIAEVVAGEVSTQQLAETVFREIHDVAGEASLLGIPAISTVASKMSIALKNQNNIERECLSELEGWLVRLLDAARLATQGDAPQSELNDLEAEIPRLAGE